MKKRAFLFSSVTLLALFAFSPGAKAGHGSEFSLPAVQPAAVTPLDTFTISVAGFNTADNTAGNQTGVLLTNVLTVTFNGLGAAGAQTFANGAAGSQTVTATTTQTVGATTTIDTIALSVPTNFVPTGTTTSSSTVINDIELDMGEFNGGTNTLDFTPAITGTPTYTGSVFYSGGTLTLTNQAATSTLTNGGASLAYYQALSTTSTAGLSQFTIKQFNFSITYPNAVPEPSTWALCALGLAGCAGVVLRRRRARA